MFVGPKILLITIIGIWLMRPRTVIAVSSDGTYPVVDTDVPLAGGIALRPMALGASITLGEGSSGGNGYRKYLRDKLVNGGNAVNFVANLTNGDMADNEVEAVSGYRVDQVHSLLAAGSVREWLPNVILVNAGTNDAAQNYSVASTGERMHSLIQDLLSWSPDVTVILSTLLINLNAATEANVEAINDQYRQLATMLSDEGVRVVLAEMHGDDGPQVEDMYDDTHPNDAGCMKMARIWYNGLWAASAYDFLEAATPLTPPIRDDGAS